MPKKKIFIESILNYYYYYFVRHLKHAQQTCHIHTYAYKKFIKLYVNVLDRTRYFIKKNTNYFNSSEQKSDFN